MKSSWLSLAIVLGLLSVLPGCKTVYGTAHNFLTVVDSATGESVSLSLQVMAPPAGTVALENGLYPGVIFVHGGSWEAGDRFGNGFDSEINTAAKKGYVAVSVDYRLTTLNADGSTRFPWPAQIQDVKCAVRWMRAHAAEYKLDPDRIGIMGISSGGHLALMAAEAPSNPTFESEFCEHAESSEVNAAVSFSGVGDMESTWNGSSLMRQKIAKLVNSSASTGVLFNALDAATRASIEDADPIRAVGASTVPVLMAHPANDFFVPMVNEQLYYNALIADGRDAYLLRLDRGGHYTNAEGLAAEAYSEIQMYKWFDRHLKGAAVTLPCGGATQCDVVVP